ncbi:OmpA family protein [Phyllobacterium myrsinacearum]|uniref:Outer membrane protein OmpA-like peptidoglycan-associated protein n=1 Tax=Phyllobacterium myrsinacearum TaxID=28101 RepID=A0A839EK35_9HYPH|nr:OmpA family protein [Phyllobacterium myrsinacearum]MBA8876857.1 outer membrane protein OmpA-like peptidoglycan-associated protein [Phyllobacterium myrsinacearum]
MTKADFFHLFRVFVTAVAASIFAASFAHAADKAGCKDFPGIKRFEGSSIMLCDGRNFAEYTLPTGKWVKDEEDSAKSDFASKEALEGRLTQNVYSVPAGPSSAEVFRNYVSDLQSAGYSVLFQAKQEETRNLEQVFGEKGPGGQLFGYSPDEARYVAAVKEEGGVKTYIALYVIEFEGGYVPEFDAVKGQVYVRLDSLQVGKLTEQMVLVSAAEINKGLDTSGKVVLYGIQFDFNKASIKPESRSALDEIAKFLKEQPGQKVYVIGHTDNVGGFDFNMQLSKARAASVVADLVKTYGIAQGRLKASGVGLQAPVASNADEDGRAKNRRVELLPQ